MSRYGLIRAVLAVAVILIAGAVWGVGQIQSSADDDATHAINAGDGMLISMLDQETGLRGFINTRRPDFLEPYRSGRANFEDALSAARRHATDRMDRRSIAQQVTIARRWQTLAESELINVESGADATVPAAQSRKVVMDRFRAANKAFVVDKQGDRAHDRRVAQVVSVAIVLLVGLAFGVLTWLVFERPARREARRRRRQAQFADALQVARSENEAFAALRRHVEGWLERARAVVLIRNASQNRLEAATTLDDTPVLAGRLESAAPDNCLAIRLAKLHQREPSDKGLLVCEVCGALPEASSCVPTIVGGEVIGSVLVQTPGPLDTSHEEDLVTSVNTAGPVIANLRNLALAQRRAATDALTGLANQRSVADNLKRLAAQAGRSKSPLTAIMFDLDHFKMVNDIHGHAKGDEVLATVATVVQTTMRESDFVGRYGGEEFVALLPDTAREGGVTLAEKMRHAIEGVEIPELDGGVTASFGVAALPGDAVSAEQLLRAADRALYAAKNAGRNRVEVVRSGEGRGEPAERR